MVPFGDLPPTFWITRDRIMGVLADEVSLWRLKPDADFADDGDVLWLHTDMDAAHLGMWDISHAKKMYAGSPDNAREIVRVGI